MPRSTKKKKKSTDKYNNDSPTPEIPAIALVGTTSLMVQRAIASAARHGINLIPGRANPALGDCALEAMIFNVNDRSCFQETFPLNISYYRRIWCTDMENRLFDTPFNPGYSRSDWTNGWNLLKQPRVYEVDYFGDFIIPAIACGIKKTLLIFNTNIETPRTPIEIVNPSIYNVHPTTEIPVVLAYNESHYESLHPQSSEDDNKCIQLVKAFQEGRYHKTFNDLRELVSLENVPKTNNVKEASKVKKIINVTFFSDRTKLAWMS